MAEQISDEDVIIENINQYTKCFTLSNGRFQCNAAGCTSKLSYKSSAIRHLKAVHPDLAAAIDANKKSKNSTKSIEIRATVDPAKIWNAITHMIVFCAVPFAILQSKGFRYMIEPFATAFRNSGLNFTMDPPHLQKFIGEKANELKQKISNEAKNNMVCLLLDIASRFNRSILGVSIVYWFDGKKRTRTIGMHTLKVSQTGPNLFGLVKKMLSEFDISLEQIFSVTSDNGKNMIKVAQLLEKELLDKNDETSSFINDSDENSDDEQQNNAFENERHNDELFDPDIYDDEYFFDLLANLRDEFDCTYHGLFTGISCAAHCLHLVVNDAINTCTEISKLVEKCRSLAKKLRTPKLRGELLRKKQKMALIDVKTRWSSLFNMVSLSSLFTVFKFNFYTCMTEMQKFDTINA